MIDKIVGEGITFDDVLLIPRLSSVVPTDVDTSTTLTRDIRLNIPIVSPAMDTVTESKLAIALAQEGGMGIIHRNMNPADQSREVSRVKRFEACVIADVILLVADTAPVHSKNVIESVRELKKRGIPKPIVAGNIATAEAARDLVAAGADGVKVGIGPGSICTTRIIAGVGVPQITAIAD